MSSHVLYLTKILLIQCHPLLTEKTGITSIQDNNGPNITQVFDEIGQLTSRTISGSGPDQVTTFEYSERNQLVAIVDPQNRRTEIEYELFAVGCGTIDKPTLIRDPAGRITQLVYDKMSRLIAVVDPQGGKTKFLYNQRGDRTGVIDPNGNLTEFEFDGNRRLTKRIRRVIRTGERNKPVLANQVTRFFYDQADRLIREETDLLALNNGTNKGKLVTELTYDELDRVSRKVIKEEYMGQETIKDDSNFTYSRQLDVTRLASANNQTVNLSFDYENVPPFSITNYSTASVDPANPLGLIQGNFSVTPDTTGEIGAISKDGSQLYSKSYDTAGRLVGVVSNFNSQSYAATIIRDALGRKTNVDNNGLLSVINYDVLNRITSLTYSGIDNFSQNITYNTLTGNIDQIIREIGTFNYTHDNLDQLTGVNFSGTPNLGPLVTNRTMDYDKAGNRIDDSFYGVTDSVRNTVLNNEQWTYYTDRNGLGDIIQKSNETEAHLFEYRSDKKLKKFTLLKNNTETQVNYFYDGLGRRIAKLVNTPTESFTNTYAYEADQDKIILGKSGQGDETLYIDGQGIDEHLTKVNANEVKPYIVNHLGTVLNSDAADSTRATGAFGEILQSVNTISSSTEPVSYGFVGRQLDTESNLYYFRARTLDADSGRFLTQDPIGFDGEDFNLYRYVGNSAVFLNDPTGLLGVFGGYKVQGGIGIAPGPSGGFNAGARVFVDVSDFEFQEVGATGTIGISDTVFGASVGRGLEGGVFFLDARAFREAREVSIDTPFGSASLFFNNGFLSGFGIGGPSLGASFTIFDPKEDFNKSIGGTISSNGGFCKLAN